MTLVARHEGLLFLRAIAVGVGGRWGRNLIVAEQEAVQLVLAPSRRVGSVLETRLGHLVSGDRVAIDVVVGAPGGVVVRERLLAARRGRSAAVGRAAGGNDEAQKNSHYPKLSQLAIGRHVSPCVLRTHAFAWSA